MHTVEFRFCREPAKLSTYGACALFLLLQLRRMFVADLQQLNLVDQVFIWRYVATKLHVSFGAESFGGRNENLRYFTEGHCCDAFVPAWNPLSRHRCESQ